MTDDEIKEVVRKYIIDGYESDNGSGLHEQDEFYSRMDEDSDGDPPELTRAYEFYRKAKVTVRFD